MGGIYGIETVFSLFSTIFRCFRVDKNQISFLSMLCTNESCEFYALFRRYIIFPSNFLFHTFFGFDNQVFHHKFFLYLLFYFFADFTAHKTTKL